MPTKDEFKLEILVGDHRLKEYKKDDHYYVISNLHDEKYTQMKWLQLEGAEDSDEQDWPVTPYKVRASVAGHLTGVFRVKIYVDGFLSQMRTIRGGTSITSDGFADKVGDQLHIRQYCFSLPRIPKDKTDKVESDRASKVGRIVAEFYDTKYKEYVSPPAYRVDNRTIPAYKQATKRDASAVSGGAFTMCTTMSGDVTQTIQLRKKPRHSVPWHKHFIPTALLCKLVVNYRMEQDLVAMGLLTPRSPPKPDTTEVQKEETPRSPPKPDLKTNPIVIEEKESKDKEVSDIKCHIEQKPKAESLHSASGHTIKIKDEYDSDELEVLDSYIEIANDSDLFIVEDLVEPSILEIDESIMEGGTD